MRVIVEASVFRTDRGLEYHADLLTLFRLGLSGRHTLEIDDRKDPRYAKWYLAEGQTTQKLCDVVLNRGAKKEAKHKRGAPLHVADIAAPVWHKNRLPLAAALNFLQRPLVLLVENGRNERYFLQTITRLVDDFDLEALVRKNDIALQSQGGTENLLWLKAEERTVEELLRLWVLSDSDARQSWRYASGNEQRQWLGELAQGLLKVCESRAIPIHVLDRRSIENYLPLPLLKKWSEGDANREAKYKALAELRPNQRHHYNMKEGFDRDEKTTDHKIMVGSLYDHLPPTTRQTLGHGFNTRSPKVNICELFKGDSIYIAEKWLRQDHQEDEARRIVKSIRANL